MEICEITSSMFPEDATGKVFGKYRINHGSSWDTEISKYITSRRPVTYEEITRIFEVEIESYLNLTFSFRMVAAGEYRITIGELYANMYFFDKVTSNSSCVRKYIDPFIYYGFSKYVDSKLTLGRNFRKQFPLKRCEFASELKKYVRVRKNRLERESYEKRIRNLEARVAELTTNKEEVIEKTVIYRITDKKWLYR